MRLTTLRITALISLAVLLLSTMGCEPKTPKIDERTKDFGDYIAHYTDSVAQTQFTDSIGEEYIKGYMSDSALFKLWISDLKADSTGRMDWLYRKAAIIHSLDSLYGRPLTNKEAVKNISLLNDRYQYEWPVGSKYVMTWRYIENFTTTKTYLYNWQAAQKKLKNQ